MPLADGIGVRHAWRVQDSSSTDHAASHWRNRFRRADRLPADASADEKRARGREFGQILCEMLAEAGLGPRTRFRPGGEEIDGSFCHRGRVLLLEAKWTHDRLPAHSESLVAATEAATVK